MLTEKLQYMWFNQESINEIELYLFGPVFYLLARKALPGIRVVWMEWKEREEQSRKKEVLRVMLELLTEKIYEQLSDKKDVANKIVGFLNDIINNRKKMTETWSRYFYTDLLWQLPEETQVEINKLIKSHSKWVSQQSGEREMGMARKVENDGYKKAIIIVWGAHLIWLKELLKKYHIKTSSNSNK